MKLLPLKGLLQEQHEALERVVPLRPKFFARVPGDEKLRGAMAQVLGDVVPRQALSQIPVDECKVDLFASLHGLIDHIAGVERRPSLQERVPLVLVLDELAQKLALNRIVVDEENSHRRNVIRAHAATLPAMAPDTAPEAQCVIARAAAS